MKLSTRITIAAMATAAAVGTTGAFLLPAASARAVTHTLTFTSVQQATAKLSPTIQAAEDKDVTQAGKVIGYDVLRFSFNPKTNTTSIGVAVDLSGGFLYGVMTESSGPVTHGTVTGGTGAFKGATGTIAARRSTKPAPGLPSPLRTTRNRGLTLLAGASPGSGAPPPGPGQRVGVCSAP